MTMGDELLDALNEEQDAKRRAADRAERLQELREALDTIKSCALDWNCLEADVCTAFLNSPWYAPGDEEAPFFSEAFLYCLLGKEEARTVLAIVNRVLQALGEVGR
jgi:hypothetical protein